MKIKSLLFVFCLLLASLASGHAHAQTFPCDILASNSTPCIAAHSMVRKMFSSYAGNLFQIERASDSTTTNVGTIAGGMVNISTITSFCAGTTCKVMILYDQVNTPSSGNNLPATTFSAAPSLGWVTTNFGKIPVAVALANQFLRNRTNTINMPTGNSATTEYMVVDSQRNNGSYCCGSYGNEEVTVADTGQGHMFALTYNGNNQGEELLAQGRGPWACVDFENGVWCYGPTIVAPILTVLGKYNPSGTTWAIEFAPYWSPTVTTVESASAPGVGAFEGGLSLGEGGDGTPGPVDFLEGAITATDTTLTIDNLVQANINTFFTAAYAP